MDQNAFLFQEAESAGRFCIRYLQKEEWPTAIYYLGQLRALLRVAINQGQRQELWRRLDELAVEAGFEQWHAVQTIIGDRYRDLNFGGRAEGLVKGR